ncbi:MAG TPA: hypothetical protein VNH18_28890 [Bryobacteraceae bacterium]|nr:hypothetical protein [Bryobacteraceae bacterium]
MTIFRRSLSQNAVFTFALADLHNSGSDAAGILYRPGWIYRARQPLILFLFSVGLRVSFTTLTRCKPEHSGRLCICPNGKTSVWSLTLHLICSGGLCRPGTGLTATPCDPFFNYLYRVGLPEGERAALKGARSQSGREKFPIDFRKDLPEAQVLPSK